ncbi:MAG TPA: M20/M25/M40 family metallo-hydrolase [Candidatus Angelobacter sp.]|nr:M20/M25/M40 family metallo-hydrolase [Candidatus Angelobacter sp.]
MQLIRRLSTVVCLAVLCALITAQPAAAQQRQNLIDEMRTLVDTPAVPGYEQELTAKIVEMLAPHKAQRDNLGDVIVTIGSGAPHRLLVAPIDEPGFVVSGITPNGYLTLQRLPQGGNLPLFNELYAAEPVKIDTPQHKWIDGSVAGISIHLFPQRQHPPSMADLDNMYVDVGATSAAQARAAGADVLSPLAIQRNLYVMDNGRLASPAIGDRFGAAALLQLLTALDPAKLKGTVTFAFVTQQWLGARGLQRVLQEQKPDELIYLGRLIRPLALPGRQQAEEPEFTQKPGSGVLVAEQKPEAELSGLAGELKQLAAQNNISLRTDFSAPLLPRGRYLPQPKLPDRTVHLAIATAWPSTPGEYIDSHDLAGLVQLLSHYLGSAVSVQIPAAEALTETPLPTRPTAAPSEQAILKRVVETYGVSSHEGNVTKTISQLLPSWAKPQVDAAGNLILHWGGSTSKGPRIAVVAHQDEIGYEVHSILPDGTLEVITKGGGVLAYFLGHPALVHSANGIHPGVMELPEGWEKSDFQWPRGRRETLRVDVGAQSAQDVAQLGIKTGDFVTIPKQYHNLLSPRASARSFDDRVGCSSLIAAVWALGPNLNGRDVTFIWSTGEELGLVGAAAAAKALAAQGSAPDYVFAVDTFVSSDSPLESKRFGDGILGKGFVVRAVDNSNIVPRNLEEKVVSLARNAKIPAQYGVTGGGNDGSAFLLYGSIDVALGWPLRYSHSPAEVIDLRDLDALSKIVAGIARNW